MPIKPRVYLAGVPVHIIQRGNNRQAIFACDEDIKAYVTWLKDYAKLHIRKITQQSNFLNHLIL